MKESEWDFILNQSIFLLGVLIQGLVITIVVWIFEGFPQKFSGLGLVILITQLISWGVVIFAPLIIMFLTRFKIVRRE